MTKNEYIEKYGIEAYERRLEHSRKWKDKNRESYRERHKVSSKAWHECQRKLGYTPYCTEGYELIENYSIALKDEFDPKKWHLHHRDENLHGKKWLMKNNQYYNLTPDKLIWLPYSEHRSDSAVSAKHPELSKWHQRIYDR